MHMTVILKFFENEKNPGSVISRTLKKVAVISKNFLEKASRENDAAKEKGLPLPWAIPQDKDLWVCRIIKESCLGENKGCFIVEPIEKIEHDRIRYLLPGGYTQEVLGGRLLVRPKTPGLWMIDLMHKNLVAARERVYCVIVDLAEPLVPDEDTLPVGDDY